LASWLGQGRRLAESLPAQLVVRACRPTAPLAALGITLGSSYG
jgi:hypothetical protein